MKKLRIGRHWGTAESPGYNWAQVADDGKVTIWTEFDNPDKKGGPSLDIDSEDWSRLVAWVEWQKADRRTPGTEME
ncbi:MAG: hypothetical protein ABIH70_02250 [Chloroflexota bacterium]